MNARFLLRGVAARSVESVDWEVVYYDLMPRVYNFFRYRVGDNTLAEDLTAATFARAWRFREQYSRDLGAFSTWLFSIAHHIAIDHFRRSEPPTVSLNAGDWHDDPADEGVLSDAGGESLDDTMQRLSDTDRLGVLLSRLPERERTLISLKYGAELTNRAIAEMTGMSESNVGTSLHRIVQKLRKQWDT